MTSPATLHGALEATARLRPNATAISMGDEAITYGTLHALSRDVAADLRKRGVMPGDRVGILARKGLGVYLALYGILEAGAAYVPINPEAPRAYVRSVLDDCGIQIVFTNGRGNEMLSGMGVDHLRLPAIDRETPPPPIEFVDRGFTGDESATAYILYTSGTTGRPKGIAHSHRSALAFARAIVAHYRLQPSDRLTNHAPLHFDLSTFDLFGSLLVGAEVVVVSEAVAKFPAEFSKLLESRSVTVSYAVPFAFVQLSLRGALERRQLSELRWIVFAGEPFPTKHLRELKQQLPHTSFSNIYGPTETNGVTRYDVPDLDPDNDAPIPIGVPFEGMMVILVDREDREVPTGETAELLVSTDTRMDGYWGRPDLTESATAAIERDGRVMAFHRTGDLARRDESGLLWLVGRKDRQVKTRGHRVELDEIEAILVTHPGIEEAVVVTTPDPEGSMEIGALVRMQPGTDWSPDLETSLKRRVGEHLPRYAVPASISLVAEIPRTATGKVDRAGLDRAMAEGGMGGR